MQGKLIVVFRVSAAGIIIGFLVGIYEGVLILLHQRHVLLIEPAASPAVLYLAPLVDAFGYGLLGAILGSVVALNHERCAGMTSYLWALGLSVPYFQLLYLPAHEWIKISDCSHLVNVMIALLGSSTMVLVSLPHKRSMSVLYTRWEAKSWFPWSCSARGGVIVLAAAFAILASCRIFLTGGESQSKPNGIGDEQPNIVMIGFDAARADHISAYGYPKPTTPNLDSLAKRGVLFETAVAPSPWTLPSFAAILTGLMPHQAGTSWEAPLGKGTLTLAGILRSRGYQCVGFNANPSYGTTRTGLAQGFDAYDDDDGTLRSNLINIELVKGFWFAVYYPLIRPQPFPRRDARTLNQAIFKWLRHRSHKPFFILVNYIDVHEPYSVIPEIRDRFGTAETTLTQRIRTELHQMTWGIDPPRSEGEQAALIARYDSGLAFADSQLGNLMQFLKSCSGSSNTYVIVFGDHGQAFGTHHHYGHGWGLHWELLHVPLVIAGPGVPESRRVKDPVSLQDLFATVIDLSASRGTYPNTNSFRCSWTLATATQGRPSAVISEFVGHDNSFISVVSSGRHLIRDAGERFQLYDLTTDPGEDVNLAATAEHQAELANLQGRLIQRIRASAPPWLGDNYLFALGGREYSLLLKERKVRANWPTWSPQRSSAPDKDLLQSLPYQ